MKRTVILICAGVAVTSSLAVLDGMGFPAPSMAMTMHPTAEDAGVSIESAAPTSGYSDEGSVDFFGEGLEHVTGVEYINDNHTRLYPADSFEMIGRGVLAVGIPQLPTGDGGFIFTLDSGKQLSLRWDVLPDR